MNLPFSEILPSRLRKVARRQRQRFLLEAQIGSTDRLPKLASTDQRDTGSARAVDWRLQNGFARSRGRHSPARSVSHRNSLSALVQAIQSNAARLLKKTAQPLQKRRFE